ncbi:hypothetical protein C8F01DRAFT_1303941 [Mycena amicta]|nr:hypothetical protein C8F01DRAFT_1303941 [Mycena amicta]
MLRQPKKALTSTTTTTSTRPQREAARNNQYLNNMEDSDNDHEADGDFPPPPADDSDEEADTAGTDEVAAGARPGRDRRPSDKQQHLIDAAKEATAQQQARADKAARRAAGEPEGGREPINDDFFSTEVVPNRAKTIKDLAQRTSRVPATNPIPGARVGTTRPRDTSSTQQGHQQPARAPEQAVPRFQHNPQGHRVQTTNHPVHYDDEQHHQRRVDHQRDYMDNNNNNRRYTGSSRQLDLHYSEHGDLQDQSTQLAFDARFPGHGGRRLSGGPVEHTPRPERQQQRHITFAGRELSPPAAPVLRNPSTGEPFPTRFSIRIPSSPQIGDKRTHSDTLDDDDDDGLVDLDDELCSLPEARTTASGNRAKPALKDQDTSAQEYLKHMIIGTRNYTSVVNAFPDAMTVIDVIAEQKEKAEDALGGHFGITPQQSKLVAGRISHLRGEGKTKIAPIVEATWFETGLNAKIVSRNRKMAQTLKENSGFAYLDPENRKGLYKNPVLQKAVNTLWFANRRDEGPSFPELYKPLPIPALALILTLIENCVDEWLTGIKTPTPFTANEYRTVYESHIMSLSVRPKALFSTPKIC